MVQHAAVLIHADPDFADESAGAITRYVTRHLTTPSVDQQAITEHAIATELDSTGDMSAETQIKLQMLMDRRSKTLEMLSNLEKSLSDTSSVIVANLKWQGRVHAGRLHR